MLKLQGVPFGYRGGEYSLEIAMKNQEHTLQINPDGEVDIYIEGYSGYGGCGHHNVYTQLTVNDAKKIVAWLTKNIIDKPIPPV